MPVTNGLYQKRILVNIYFFNFFSQVFKKDLLLFVNWKDIEEKICGNLIVDIEFLKKNTEYEVK